MRSKILQEHFCQSFFVNKNPFTQKQTEIDKTYLEEEINHFDSRLTLLLINWKFFMMHSKKNLFV